MAHTLPRCLQTAGACHPATSAVRLNLPPAAVPQGQIAQTAWRRQHRPAPRGRL